MPHRRVLLALLLASLCACVPWRRAAVRQCFSLSQLPQVFSSRFRVESLQGRYYLRISRGGQVGVLRGRFLYLASDGLWAEGHDPFGGRVLEAWAKGGVLHLLFPRDGVLYTGELQGEEEVCLAFGQTRGGVPTLIEGEAGPWRLRLKLKGLEEAEGRVPAMSVKEVPVLPLRELFELLWGAEG